MSVSSLPCAQTSNIPHALRQLAHELENNPGMAVRMLVAWESANGVVRLSCYSPAMFRRMDALAILEVAKLDVMGVMVE